MKWHSRSRLLPFGTLSHEQADRFLKGATFRIHLGQHRDDKGVLRDHFATGFFGTPNGLALTAFHNFDGCVRGQVFKADYKKTTIELQWLTDWSSQRADIAVMQLHSNPQGVRIQSLRVGYLDPSATLAARKEFFGARVAVSIFGYPQRKGGGESWRVDGAVDNGQPIIVSHEAGGAELDRLLIHGARIEDLEGISGAAILDLETGLTIGVEGAYDVQWVEADSGRDYWKGAGDVRGSEIAGLVAEHPKLAEHFELIVRYEPWLVLALCAAVTLPLIVGVGTALSLWGAGKSPGTRASVFPLEGHYQASGKTGDINDVEILAQGGGLVRFEYSPTGQAPHEWDWKYLPDGKLNPIPAHAGGVLYLSPVNSFGMVKDSGYDLRGHWWNWTNTFRRLTWEARRVLPETSADREASANQAARVHFVLGGVNWTWIERDGKWEKGAAPYPDTMPQVSLGIKRVSDQWQPFDDGGRLLEEPEESFKRVVGGFGWTMSWSSKGVESSADGGGVKSEKSFVIEIRKLTGRKVIHHE